MKNAEPAEPAEPAELLPRPRAMLIAATLVAISTTYLGLHMAVSIVNFQAMFKELGLTPSPVTELVFSVPRIWWLFALASVGVLVWIASRARVTAATRRHMKTALVVTVALTALFYAFTAYAIYMPLFELSGTV